LNTKFRALLLISLNLILCYCVCTFLYNLSYSLTSPDFVRQDILDISGDPIIAPNFINKNLSINKNIVTDIKSCSINDSLTNSSLVPYGDITEVSYLSDGKFFNTTLWVNDFVNFSNPLFPEGIDIFEIHNKDNSTLSNLANEFVEYELHQFRSNNDLRSDKYLKSNENITLGKEDALKFEVLTQRNDTSHTEEKYLFVIVEHSDRVYAFVFSSLSHRYNDLIDDVTKVMQSFTFIDNDINITHSKNRDNFYTGSSIKIAFEYPPDSKIEEFGQGISGVRVNFPTPDYKLMSKSYQILVDVKSAFDNGIDYIERVWYDNSSQKWKDSFYETKSLKELQNKTRFESAGNLRTIRENEYTKFPTELLNKLSKQSLYVPLSINLSDINFPTTYDVYFVTTSLYNTTNGLCNIIDTTSFTPIPPPKMNITLIPDTLELRPGEQTDIEITIDPSTRLPYKIKLESESGDIIGYKFTSNNGSGIHKGIFKTNINVAALNKEGLTYPSYNSLPIKATLMIEPSHKDILTDYIIRNNLFSNTNSTVYLPIKVIKPLDLTDYFASVANRIASPLGLIISTLGLIVAGIMGIFKWFQSHKKKSNKIEEDGSNY